MVYDIKGKVALITGGAAGIGLAYGEELLKNGIEGLIVADVNEKQGNEAVEKFNKTYGPKKATFMKTDVTKKEQLEAAFQLAKSTYSKLDIVINNAGILNDAHWELEIAINCVFWISILLRSDRNQILNDVSWRNRYTINLRREQVHP
ncbi:unnamed protein product [Acanthoscelides obtectus]|uniref:Uncharacterized protein n=1 Tax=Acanthoscelides obtectus TaxID=200917 RepID=A0A9P0MAT1_ACAOB|nr:unnamed protein product [Acanthoscelides obtectus]CAK1659013.1 15-hydroxyprostaglandin dehydrogenase [NAD(+)] [Acanthoscelides obtectus]